MNVSLATAQCWGERDEPLDDGGVLNKHFSINTVKQLILWEMKMGIVQTTHSNVYLTVTKCYEELEK